MKPIKCSEPGCKAVIANPCGTVVALFAFKQAIEEQHRQKEVDDDEFNKQIKFYKENIKKTGIQEAETMYKAFKNLMTTPAAKKRTRHFVLQCVKGHTNTYQIDCD